MSGSTPNASLPHLPLATAALAQLPDELTKPTYDRSTLTPSIVHIGVGGFHRAHLATYVNEFAAAGHQDWSIVGVGILPGDARMADALNPQDGLYTLIERGEATTSVEVIGSITEYLHLHEQPQLLIDRIADPQTQIVSLTITEGGYPIDDVTGDYAADSPNAGPSGAFALITAGLEARRTSNGSSITILSCDNIMSNGNVTRTSTLGAAAAYGSELADWIDTAVSFPNSMVDRITPQTADSDREWLASTHGIIDRWPVVTEPFRQWVIEDDFAGARPPLEELDENVIITTDVEPYEFMKLRLLNAGHSCLAYLAALDGIVTVDAAMAEPSIRRYLDAFLKIEAKPVLPDVAGIDIDQYIASLVERFSNPAIGDQISRLCLDGTAKFPKFLLPTVRAQVAADGPVALSALALAGWCDYLNGQNHHGEPMQLADDPQLDEAIDYARRSLLDPKSFLEFDAVFGSDLPRSTRLIEAFGRSLKVLRSDGIRAAIEDAISSADPTAPDPS